MVALPGGGDLSISRPYKLDRLQLVTLLPYQTLAHLHPAIPHRVLSNLIGLNATQLFLYCPSKAHKGGFVSPQVIPSDVERAPVRIEPVARHEFPQRHHVVLGMVKSTGAGHTSKSTTGRGRHPALVKERRLAVLIPGVGVGTRGEYGLGRR
jgi:hypothetical protein